MNLQLITKEALNAPKNEPLNEPFQTEPQSEPQRETQPPPQISSLFLFPPISASFFLTSFIREQPSNISTMPDAAIVFIIDGCSIHYAHTWSKLGISIC